MPDSRKKSHDTPAPRPGVWFSRGLRFTCIANCGQCCSGAPGYVWLTEDEIKAIATRLGCTRNAMATTYLRIASGKVSLREQPNGDCVFLVRPGMGCSIYADRPTQCRTFPFWPEVLRSPERWEDETDYCPGVGKGRLYCADDCAAKAAETRRAGRAVARKFTSDD